MGATKAPVASYTI